MERMPAGWSRCHRILLGLVVAAHAALFAYGLATPSALLHFDRAAGRVRSARALAESGSLAEALRVLAERGVFGDYAWHGIVLWASRGWLGAVPLVQLALWALSLLALDRIAAWIGCSPRARSFAILLYALIPIDLIVPHFLASEAIFNPLLVFGTCFLVRYARRTQAARDLALAGLCYALAAVTRAEFLAWLPVLGLLAWGIAREAAGPRAPVHVLVLALATASAPACWIGFRVATTGEASYGSGMVTLGFELEQRAGAIARAAGAAGAAPGEGVADRSPLHAFVGAALSHPLAFGREWALHVAKLLALPDNLDLFRYLGVFEYTGRRAELVHTLGPLGALRALVSEMPVLTAWLLVSIGLFAVVWALALRGALRALRHPERSARLVILLLLSLPLVYTGLRVLTQGEARKRSPLDFALALFAAIGAAQARSFPSEGAARARSFPSEPDGARKG